MNEETTEEISTQSDEPTLRDVLNAVNQINQRLDGYDAQFEAIRTGIVDNNVRLSKLLALFHNLDAEVTALAEEVRHNRKVLVTELKVKYYLLTNFLSQPLPYRFVVKNLPMTSESGYGILRLK